MEDKIVTCPACEGKKLDESSVVIHEPYQDKELAVFRCKDCGWVFDEQDLGNK